jgi:uncharacterized protein YacL
VNTPNAPSSSAQDLTSAGQGYSPSPPAPPTTDASDRAPVLRVLRLGALGLMITVTMLLILQQGGSGNPSQTGAGIAINYWLTLLGALTLFGLVLVIDIFTPNKKIATISAVFLGTLTGVLLTVVLGMVIDLVLRTWMTDQELGTIQPVTQAVKVLLGIALCYLCISTVFQTQDQFRLVLPYVEFSKQIRGVRPNVIDTSALIDGRLADISATGLLQGPFVLPSFVIAELQTLADSQDRLKRQRGKRGLDLVTRLQRQGSIDLTIDSTPPIARSVDHALIETAQRLNARIFTTDLGLQRVAEIRGITVLNLHQIAAAFRSSLLPGEPLSLRIVRAGEQPGQGVGYLDDGTMVVIDHAAHRIGSTVSLIVSSVMQTTGGKLVFAKLADGADSQSDRDHNDDREQLGSPSADVGDLAPSLAEAASASDDAAAMNAASPGGDSGGPPGVSTFSEPVSMPPPQAPPRRTGPFPPRSPARGNGPSPRNPRR